MTLLSVNINKIATLRNSRGGGQPSVTGVASDLMNWGARGITVHPRPDERHIKTQDVFELAKLIKEFNSSSSQSQVEFNIEGYPNHQFLALIEEVRPNQCTLVPDPPETLTSNAGWTLTKSISQLKEVLSFLRQVKVRSSLFVDPSTFNSDEQKSLQSLSPDRIELYTESYALAFGTSRQEETLRTYVDCAHKAAALNIGLNAGHDLNQQNLFLFTKNIPNLLEVSIGHAFISEALYDGLETTLHNYHKILQNE